MVDRKTQDKMTKLDKFIELDLYSSKKSGGYVCTKKKKKKTYSIVWVCTPGLLATPKFCVCTSL